MATGLPAVTGDVLTAATFNGLITFTVGTANTADYTAVLADQYQVLQIMNKVNNNDIIFENLLGQHFASIFRLRIQ